MKIFFNNTEKMPLISAYYFSEEKKFFYIYCHLNIAEKLILAIHMSLHQ